MKKSILCCMWLIGILSLPLAAFHAEVNTLAKPLPSQQRLSQMYFQVTDMSFPLEELLSDPEHHHAFTLLTDNQRVQFREDQAVWFFARLHNISARRLDTILEYDFPLADKVEIYQVNRTTKDIQLLSRSGNDFPFSERALPYRSYVTRLALPAGAEADIYIKVVDAGLISSDIRIWRYADFVAIQQSNAMLDGVVQGTLLLLALYSLLLFGRLRARHYLYYSCFFVSFALVVAVLNGMAFALLWPSYPEINQAILYVTVGAGLLSLNLSVRHALKANLPTFWRLVSHLSSFSALLLLFSPLYANGQWRLFIMFGSLVWVLGSNMLLALRISLLGQHQARLFIWACFFSLLSALLLTLSHAGYLPTGFNWLYMLLLLVIISMAFISFSMQKLTAASNSNDVNTRQLRQYYDIFHNAVEGMFITTLDGRLLTANRSLLDILGYSSLDELKKAIAGVGMARFYADPADRQQMVRQLEHGGNKNFEIRGLRADHSPFWALMSARLARSDGDKEAFIHGSVIDITEQKLAHEQLAYLANHDSLTALYNRYYFVQQLQKLCTQPERGHGCVLYLDVDQFKLINTSCSHTAGDALLKQLGELFKRVIGHNGALARLDSDEFGVLLPGKNANEAFALAYRLLDAMQEFRFIWQDNIFSVSISIGITAITSNDVSADSVIKNADAACCIAKEKGRNRIQLFDTNDQETQQHQAEMKWVSQLRQAITQDQFVLYQQAIQGLSDKRPGLHYELLIRLRAEDNSLIAPGSFISSAERYGLMQQIDRWVIQHYFRWLHQHPEHLLKLRLCSINLSGNSLTDPLFKDHVQRLFDEYQIPCHYICFEITESVAIVNLQNTLAFIEHFREQGCSFALDDFGSGFSSYGYLKHFPADFVKIDGHFVRDLLDDHYDKAIVKSIHDVARAVGMRTIAEYVENEEILAALKLMGVDYVQGYAIARPAPLAELLGRYK